ncbi:peptide/nickel transport system substrate-binding protein [Mumia flava]|uniref:Peptide/nickel transport system substrate-binding protein n=1 Tax=Mumia flava TaxID=1348852 RepID=A0A0B2BDS6_9ACTN|nr:peptide/nickel transport system substrate-binding protein [Mumia flava]
MRRVVTACAGLVAFACLAACTTPSPEDPADGPTTQLDLTRAGEVGNRTDPRAPAPAPEIDGATRGGTVHVVTAAVPDSLDPARSAYTDTRAILSDLVVRSLTQLAHDPDTGRMVLVPDLATDLGRPNADRTRWTFTIRRGVRFENGEPVTAADVAYGVKRAFATTELPGGPAYLRTFLVDGDRYQGPYATTAEVRARPGARPDAYAGDDFAGVEVRGSTIVFRMRRPFDDMPYLASFPQLAPVPREADSNPAAYGDHPVATGPYRIASSTPGSALQLARNTEWDPATDPGRHQYVDGWRFSFGLDPSRVNGLLLDDAGEGRAALTYDSVEPATFEALRESDPSRLAVATSPCTYLWYLDTRRIRDVRVRRALGWAYPYARAWEAGEEIVGTTRVPGTTLLPPGTAGRVEHDPLGNGGLISDPARARSLLEQAGSVGFAIRWHYASDLPEKVAAKDVVVRALRSAGFDPQPIATTAAQLRTVQRDPDGPQNVIESGWCSDWPTGSSWFPAQWAPAMVDEPGMPNPSMLDAPVVQARIDRVLGTMTGDAAAQAWGRLDRSIMSDWYPAVVLGHGGVALARGSEVGGMAVDRMTGMPVFADLYVDAGS